MSARTYAEQFKNSADLANMAKNKLNISGRWYLRGTRPRKAKAQ